MRPGRSVYSGSKSVSFLVHCRWFNKPMPGLRTILATVDFSKAFNKVWHPIVANKLVSAGLFPWFARWTQSFPSDRRACVVWVLVLYFTLISSMMFVLLCFLPSGTLFMLTNWPFKSPSPRSYFGGGHTRNSDSAGALVSSSIFEQG